MKSLIGGKSSFDRVQKYGRSPNGLMSHSQILAALKFENDTALIWGDL
ncbi:MAG: hypothetical protein ACRC62_27520 [Microcoleus sp.]